VRSAVELAKDWRTDRMLRRLEAMLVVCDAQSSLIISGNGDVLEPEQGLVAIGSGGSYAQAAARALLENTPLPPEEISGWMLACADQVFSSLDQLKQFLLARYGREKQAPLWKE